MIENSRTKDKSWDALKRSMPQSIMEQRYMMLTKYLLSKYGSCLTVAEAAQELKVSIDMIYRLTNKKELPSRKLGDRRVISSVDLAIYIIGSDR